MTPNLPELLRQAAARHPDRLAVRDERDELTYREFLAEVHQLANHLVQAKTAKGTWVACCLPRGVRAVVAQAAVMACGAVYVPVDPTYPPDLLGSMLKSDLPLRVVGYRAGIAACAAAVEVIGVPLDDDETLAVLAASSTKPPAVNLLPADGAYVIHTSGSTGIPKGVLVSHGAIAQSTLARAERYPEEVTGFLMVSPMFFDSSLAGIWWTLSQGGTLELAPAAPAALIARVRQVLTDSETGLSHTLLTPTLYRQTLDGVTQPRSALRHVVVAGEMCSDALVRRHYAALPDVELVNEYGPTEAAVWCTSAVLRADADITIGKPISTVELLVLDPENHEVPVGTAGELCITGSQLAEGYPRDAKLTAERFVPHPTRPGERLYRTGDQAMLRPDGQFTVSGRLDDQVKIRGYRVDLAGVRSRLGEHPGVADLALAMRARPGTAGEVLTAYVVPAVDPDLAAQKLREAWTQVVDEVAASAPASGTDFDTSGWNSSYTGQPLSSEAMREWVNSTVTLLREGAPATVLDLGCGSGLPLLRVAPHCERYVGLDVSVRTLDGLQKAVDGAGLQNVELRRGEAADVASFTGQGFGLVVSNSVSQYFPGGDYLARVVREGLSATRPDGRVVIGDVRDLSLLWEFYTTVALARLDPATPASAVFEQVAARVEQESQLVVSPCWFSALAATLLGVDLEIRPRRGWDRNEMNDFRYDAVMHPAGAVTRIDVPRWLDWSADMAGPDTLDALLRGLHEPLGIRQVPNARTAGTRAVVSLLQGGVNRTAEDLCVFRDAHARYALHPEALFELAVTHGCRVHLDRSAAHDGGALDVVFLPSNVTDAFTGVTLPRFDVPTTSPTKLITDPGTHRMATTASTDVLPALRRHAGQVLAPQERPGAYVLLPSLPMTRQGKVDTAALPEPAAENLRTGTAFVAARSETEKAVAGVWATVLGVDRIGIDDDFVALGGDSLMAAVCAVRLGEKLDLQLPAGVLFSAPTVRALAAVVDRAAPRGPAREDLPNGSGAPLPLTSAQTVFWYLDHYRRPGGSRHPDFALSVHYRISGPLDVRALSDAVDQLVVRHESLRTRVLLDASEGSQTVLAPPSGVLMAVRLDATDPEAALRAAACHDADDPLDPSSGKVFTARLSSASDTEHLLALRVHHVVSDGWSINVLEADLEELYEAARSGRAAALPPSPSYQQLVRQIDQTFFVDLEWRDTEPYRSALEYWSRRVEGVKPTALGPDHAPADLRPTGLHHLDLSADELETLLERSRQCGATLFSTVVAALAYLHAEDSGDADVRLLTLNAARDTPGLDRMIGLLLNPVLLRVTANPGEELPDLLPAVSASVREALAHGQVPLLAMCEEIPDLMKFMTESQFVGVEALSAARGLQLADCRIGRTDTFDDEFLGRRFQLPIEFLLVVRRGKSSVRLTVLNDPAVIDDEKARQLLTRLRQVLLASAPLGIHS